MFKIQIYIILTYLLLFHWTFIHR